MNIGIDIRRTQGEITGVGVCLVSLVEAFKRIDRENAYHFFLGGRPAQGIRSNPYFQELVWKQVVTPAELALKKIDVFFVPNPPVSFPALCPTVLMIPDVAFCALSAGGKPPGRLPLLLYRHSARKAKRIVTISECSKKDIVRYLSVPESKIDVVPLACDEIFKPVDQAAAQMAVKARFGIRMKYILAVFGTLIPRKGTCHLLDAYARLPESVRSQHQLLVVAKKEASGYSEFMAQAAARSIASDVIVTGYVAREEMPAMYRAAELFVYPSQYEGFGLPPLEAMACGAPVVASNTSSVPEVVADAGLLVNPTDAEDISKAMLRVLSDERLQDDLRKKGLKRAAAFSWDKAAGDFLKIFREAAALK